MAIYHLHVQTIGRGAGRSATAAAAYRSGERIVDVRTGVVHDYTRKKGVSHREILAPAGAPEWMLDRSALWNAVELSEARRDARLAREMDVALPRELTRARMVDLGLRWVREEATSLGMVADVCFHDLTDENPHFHVLLTTRAVSALGFGRKVRDWDGWGDRSAPSSSLVQRWRQSWAVYANRALASAGLSARVDHRSLGDQGVDRPPTVHLGRWHSINRNTRIPAATQEFAPRAVPWSGTSLDRRDRRSRFNSAVRALRSLEGAAGQVPAELARVLARHLRRRIEHVDSDFDLALLRRRALYEPPDTESWILGSRKYRRLLQAADRQRALNEARRQAEEARRLFLVDEFVKPAASKSFDEAPAFQALREWLDRVRARLSAWVSARVALAVEARRLLERRALWEAELSRVEKNIIPKAREGP